MLACLMSTIDTYIPLKDNIFFIIISKEQPGYAVLKLID